MTVQYHKVVGLHLNDICPQSNHYYQSHLLMNNKCSLLYLLAVIQQYKLIIPLCYKLATGLVNLASTLLRRERNTHHPLSIKTIPNSVSQIIYYLGIRLIQSVFPTDIGPEYNNGEKITSSFYKRAAPLTQVQALKRVAV
jgi:hypothetical protein